MKTEKEEFRREVPKLLIYEVLLIGVGFTAGVITGLLLAGIHYPINRNYSRIFTLPHWRDQLLQGSPVYFCWPTIV